MLSSNPRVCTLTPLVRLYLVEEHNNDNDRRDSKPQWHTSRGRYGLQNELNNNIYRSLKMTASRKNTTYMSIY